MADVFWTVQLGPIRDSAHVLTLQVGPTHNSARILGTSGLTRYSSYILDTVVRLHSLQLTYFGHSVVRPTPHSSYFGHNAVRPHTRQLTHFQTQCSQTPLAIAHMFCTQFSQAPLTIAHIFWTQHSQAPFAIAHMFWTLQLEPTPNSIGILDIVLLGPTPHS